MKWFGSLVVAMALFVVAITNAGAAEPAAVQHRIMVCEYSGAAQRLAEISPEGKLVWEHKFPSTVVCFRAAKDGTVLYAVGGKPTGVQLVDRDHRLLLDYHADCYQVLGCDRLPNGNFLLGQQGPCQALEIDRDGKPVSTVKLTTSEPNEHRQLRCLHQLDNGNILAALEKEGVVREFDRQGNTVWEYPHVTEVFEALRLPSGNTLIGCGIDKRVIEVTPNKQVVWELKPSDAPELNLTWITSLQVLKNGNFVIGNFLRGSEGKGAHAFEVTHDDAKRIVWKYDDHQLVKSITMVQVLDDE